MTKKDLYSVLGVDPKASTEDIKKAYRSLAKQWHPDKNKAPHAEEHFKEIGNAYQTLVDSSKRRTYDLQRDVDSAPKPSQSSRSYTYTPHSSARTSSTSGAGDNNSSKPKAHSWYTHHSNSFFSHHSKDGGDTTGPSSFSFRFESRRPRTSSFSDFRRDDYDEDSPTAKANKNSSNFEKKKPKRKSFSERPEWNNNWNDDPTFDTDSAFEMPFGGLFPGSPFESYTDTIKMFFTNLLGGSSSAPEFSSTPRGSHSTARQPRNRQHRNASHRGHSNSNLEDFMDDDMWNWKKPMFSKNDDNEDDNCFGSVDSDSDSDDMLRLECNYCGVKYHASILINHERYCRRKSNPTRDRSGMDILHDLMRNHHRSAFNPGHASNTKEHCPWCGRKCSLDEAVEHVAFCTGRPSQRPFRNPTNNTPPPPRSSTSSASRPTSANTTRASATSQQQQPRTSRFGENNSNTNRTYWHTPRTSASYANASNASTAGGPYGTYSHKKGSKSSGQGTSTTIPPTSRSSRMGSAGVQGRRFSSVN